MNGASKTMAKLGGCFKNIHDGQKGKNDCYKSQNGFLVEYHV